MPIKERRAEEICSRIGRSKILILGDVMVDEYMYGSVERISPEAPVPVVEVTSTKKLLGGAANVAANIEALGDVPLLLGVVGKDEAADGLRNLLKTSGISHDYLVADPGRPTTLKTRIIAHNQQVVRADQEKRQNLDDSIESLLLKRLTSVIDDCNGLIISDYGKGVITRTLLAEVISLCKSKSIFLAVDPKETRFHNYVDVSLITPNHHEAEFAYGRRIHSMEDLLEVGSGLLEKLRAEAILITRGAQGMSLFQKDKEPIHIPTFARKVYDVTGAGDTVIATFVSAVAAGASQLESAVIANAAAGHTVAEIGTSTISVKELSKELMRNIKNGNVAPAGLKL